MAWIQFSFVAKSDSPIQARKPASRAGQGDTSRRRQVLEILYRQERYSEGHLISPRDFPSRYSGGLTSGGRHPPGPALLLPGYGHKEVAYTPRTTGGRMADTLMKEFLLPKLMPKTTF